MGVPYEMIDAFTSEAFGGNPAIVVRLAGPADPAWMQIVAREVNQTETAFVHATDDGAYGLRWFTPTNEIDLCGHATLATAHALFESGELAADEVARFDTASGWLTVTRDGDGLRMDFPANPVAAVASSALIERAVGVPVVAVGRGADGAFTLVEVADADVVANLTPDLDAIAELPGIGTIVTAGGHREGIDFVSRTFLPQWGIPEDPVTGAAHCMLGPYWLDRVGRPRMVGEQLSERGGVVDVEVGDERVHLGGRAITVARGEFLV